MNRVVRTWKDMRRRNKGWALLPLRVVVGFGFLAHGYAKLDRGPEKFALILRAMGIPAPHLTAWVTSLTELIGGLGLMVGLAVVPLTVPLALVTLTAMFGVQLRYGFLSIRLEAFTADGAKFGPVGYELNLLYLAALLALAIGDGGPATLDGYLRRRGARGAESLTHSLS